MVDNWGFEMMNNQFHDGIELFSKKNLNAYNF